MGEPEEGKFYKLVLIVGSLNHVDLGRKEVSLARELEPTCA